MKEVLYMYKTFFTIAVISFLLTLACKEEMVGAPCTPETDPGTFTPDISGTIWSIEMGSVQCETRICLTQNKTNNYAGAARRIECEEDPTSENCWLKKDADGNIIGAPVQLKYSFCSCRCKDQFGNQYKDNPDKYEDLCECPPSTICQEVLEPIEGISDKLPGSYCVPDCIQNPCSQENGAKICTPSKSSDEPWKWYCATPPDGIIAGN
jgi:hypothetical protein